MGLADRGDVVAVAAVVVVVARVAPAPGLPALRPPAHPNSSLGFGSCGVCLACSIYNPRLANAVETSWQKIQSGNAKEGLALLRRHLAIRPRDADAWLALAHAGLLAGDLAGCIAAAERARVLLPGRPEPLMMLGGARLAMGDTAGARAFEQAIALDPHSPAPFRAWGDALIRTFRQDEAALVLREGVRILGDDPALLLSLSYALNVAGGASPQEERAWHQRLAMASGGGQVRPGGSRTGESGRPLRVAILSADFREHSCAFFLLAPLKAIDPARVALFLYSTTRQPDSYTERFQTLGTWRDCGRLSVEQVVSQARADAIDLLIDASGWTVASHIPALAARLAPVQVSYLGYPATTGLTTMDFRIVDATTDPHGSDADCTERLLRLAGCFVCFSPETDWPTPALTPFQRGVGPPVFGSFNNAAKISPGVVALWSRLLRQTPGSRLLLKAAGFQGAYGERLRERFVSAGVEAARIEFADFSPTTAEHMRLYSRVDVALDPFPYNGTTTTCEALWMGVPVVSLTGDRHRARVGASLLASVGRQTWLAEDDNHYVDLASGLVAKPAGLEALRVGAGGEASGGLRAQIQSSPLCDAPSFARQFEAALAAAWQREPSTEL